MRGETFMEYAKLGKSDLVVSKIGLGTWQFGDKDWGWGAEYGEDEALATIHRALDLGINLIDTAEVYGDGISEAVVGKAIQARRDEVIIATKVWGGHLRYGDVLQAAEGSLRRLGIETIDLYQIHWPSYHVPLEETMEALQKLVEQGKVRYIGVSSFSVPLLREAQRHFKGRIISNQVRYNLLQREIEREILPYCRREGITVIAYSPLAQGLLTGKFREDFQSTDGIRKANPLFDSRNLGQALKVVEVLGEIAADRGKTTAQVALNWLIQRPGVVAIPGAKRPEQIEESAGACGWKLTQEELSWIEEVCGALKLSYFRYRD